MSKVEMELTNKQKKAVKELIWLDSASSKACKWSEQQKKKAWKLIDSLALGDDEEIYNLFELSR